MRAPLPPWIDYTDYDVGIYPTIANMREDMQLAGRCLVCGHRVRLYRNKLLRTLSNDVYLINVRRKLKCELCGNRNGNRLLCRIVEP